MKTTAAVLVETRQPLVLAELEIPPLKPGQVLVEIAYSGVCHTQLLECRGHRGNDPYLPHCLGHEGSGRVLDVGPDVTRCRPGDRVLLSWIKANGISVPNTLYDWNGRKVNAGGVTTFALHSVISEDRVSVLPDEIDFRDAALLGCAVPTGMGAVFNTASPKPGQSIAVFGTGGVGLCSVAAAAIAELTPVIAVDVSASRLKIARELGATHCVDATRTDPVEEVTRICPGGADFAVEASGRPEVMVQALQSVRNQGGAAVIVGNAHHGEHIPLDPRELNHGKRLLGTWGGDNQPDRDFPRYCELISTGRLSLDPLVTRTYELSEINQALDDLEGRRVPRPVIEMKHG